MDWLVPVHLDGEKSVGRCVTYPDCQGHILWVLEPGTALFIVEEASLWQPITR